MQSLPVVTVIIPTYRDWDRLRLCLASLVNQSYPYERYEVIVVNNDPNDPIPELRLPDNFQIFTEAAPGSYAARNKAISLAKGDVFAFTDSDCIPALDWIAAAVNKLQHGAERVAGHVELFFRSDKLTHAEIYEKAFVFNQRKSAAGGSSVTANMVTWRKHFDTVGLFNEALMSGGDNEWGWRAQALGIPIVYSPEVVVKHPARTTLKELFSKRKRVVGGAVNIPRMNKQDVGAWVLRGFMPPIKLIRNLAYRKDLTFHEKLIASYLAYLIKMYNTTQKIILKMGLAKPQRV